MVVVALHLNNEKELPGLAQKKAGWLWIQASLVNSFSFSSAVNSDFPKIS